MLRTVVLPAGNEWFAYVYDGDRFVGPGPIRDTPEEAEAEALRYAREGAHLPRALPRLDPVVYHAGEKDVKTVSSDINGKPAAVYWGGMR